MAIEYVRVIIIGRSKGKNACERAAYNGNCKIKDWNINHTFNSSHFTSNVYHEIVLPEYASHKFKCIEALMNEVERCEKQKNSQLLLEYMLALPGEKIITLEHKIKLIKLFIEKLEFIKNGLGVVIDIHKPEQDEINWYAKLLVTTRAFDASGEFLKNKLRDTGLQIKQGKGRFFVQANFKPGHIWRGVQNEYFQLLGLDLKVNDTSRVPQEHIGTRKYGIMAEQKRLRKQGLQ